MNHTVKNNLYDFLATFLPDLEYCLDSLPEALDKLGELRSFYSGQSATLESYQELNSRIVVIPMGDTSWLTQVKSSLLFADYLICDDPLLYVADTYTSRVEVEKRYDADFDEMNLNWLKRQVDAIWEAMPLIESGVLTYFDLRREPSNVVQELETSARLYLEEHLEITGRSEPGTYPYLVDIYVPLLDFRGSADISRGLLGRDIMEHEQAVRQYLPPLLNFSVSTLQGLSAADATGGTFWSDSDWIWRLCRDAVGSLAPQTRIYSFVHELERPHLERASIADLMNVRSLDDAMYAFRRELVLSQGLIKALPDDPTFDGEIRSVFNEIFRPNLVAVESAMKRNRLLKELPWLAAAAGFAYAASATSPSSELISGIFGSLSAAAGFGSLYRSLSDPEASVRREPAFVLWKVAQIGNTLA